MKVYLVTDGSYSDYHLCCVCSSKEKADHAKKFYAATNDIEEYELDALPDHPQGMFWYSVRMDRNGDTHAVEIENGDYTHADEWRPYGDNETVSFDMWATDEKHAVKIANERRAMIVASGEWTTNWDQWSKRKQNANPHGRTPARTVQGVVGTGVNP